MPIDIFKTKGEAGVDGADGAAGGGPVEGGYTSWLYQWSVAPPNGCYGDALAWFIDENNAVYTLVWKDSSQKLRFGIYNLSNHTIVFESTAGAHYTSTDPFGVKGVCLGHADRNFGISRTLETYTLIVRNDYKTLEVWQGGSSALWSRDTTIDDSDIYPYYIGISITGKYIMVYSTDLGAKLALYEAT